MPPGMGPRWPGGEGEHQQGGARLGRASDRGSRMLERSVGQAVQAADGEQQRVAATEIAAIGAGDGRSRVLVTGRCWTLDEYEAWLADTLFTQLMTGSPPDRQPR
jgi:hypothetical protein